MAKQFIKYLLLFFIPVLLGYTIIEYLTLNLPAPYRINADIIEKEANSIEVLILGSSQMDNAVNPALLKQTALNLASGDQHHNTDFKLLQSLLPRLKNLETVVLEVSYSHFELPHNNTDFWKNSVYLKYYGVNCFDRNTYFKDKLIYLSFPEFYSKKIYSHYILGEERAGFNKFGFDTLNYEGQFKELNYDEKSIALVPRFKINSVQNLEIFKQNTALFLKMLDFLVEHNKNVIVCSTPMYKSYLPRRDLKILARRDSILQLVSKKYTRISFLTKEEDTLDFKVTDYWNQSHLNPSGAAKFTTLLQQKLNSLQ